jgi:hypothetical protein
VLEGARNLLTGCGYIVLDAPPLRSPAADEKTPAGKPVGPYFFRFSKAVDFVVQQAIMTDPAKSEGWCVVRVERDRPPRVVWPDVAGDNGDGEESIVPRRPRRPSGSGAVALPLPEERAAQ